MMKKIIVVLLCSFLLVMVTTSVVVINAFNNQKLNILLYGVDGRNVDEVERSDAIILINVNFNNSSVTATSIPRDSYVKIACKNDMYDKINHAYAFGGQKCLNDTVKHLFGIDKIKNIVLDFKNVEKLIDYFGLIELIPAYSFCQSDIEFKQKYCFEKDKKILINGSQALAYMRNRKSLPQGDLDRAKNQRQILRILIGKFMNLSLIDKVKYFNYAKKIVQTDVSIDDFNIKKMINVNHLTIHEYTLKGEDYKNVYYYYKLDTQYLEKIKKYYI